jgi:anti-sigma factor RsiW
MMGDPMRVPPHQETFLVHALADGELTPFEAARLRVHLARCPICALELCDAIHLGELGERLARVDRGPFWWTIATPPRS